MMFPKKPKQTKTMSRCQMIAYRIYHSFGLRMTRCPNCRAYASVEQLEQNFIQIACQNGCRTLTRYRRPEYDFKQFVCLAVEGWNNQLFDKEQKPEDKK